MLIFIRELIILEIAYNHFNNDVEQGNLKNLIIIVIISVVFSIIERAVRRQQPTPVVEDQRENDEHLDHQVIAELEAGGQAPLRLIYSDN